MNLIIEKKHNEQIVIMEDEKVLSVKNIVIEARVGEPVKEIGEPLLIAGSCHTYMLSEDKIKRIEEESYSDILEVILTLSNGHVTTRNNKNYNITLDMKFGGDYELITYGSDDELKKRIIFSKGGEILGRIQKFRYELSTETTYGKAEMELILT